MKKLISLTLTSVAILTLTACGGGGASDNSSSEEVEPEAITGHVGDGYIEGAYVCHDSNNNLDCLDDVYTTTVSDGSFTLSNYNAALDLMVQIPIGAVDNGPFSDGSIAPRPFAAQTWYYYPAQAAPANGPIFIGPLSTLVFAQQEAVPGMTFDEAVEVVGNSLGISGNQLTSNYLEDNSSEGNETQFIAEIIGSSIANTANDSENYSDDIQVVLGDTENVVNTATENSSTSYDTSNYTPQGNNTNSDNVTVALIYEPVTDLCDGLSSAKYFAFEDWDNVLNPNAELDHKTLYMSNDVLNLHEEGSIPNPNQIGNTSSSIWQVDPSQTTTENEYLQNIEGVTIDMANVNGTNSYTQNFYDIPLPAQKISCDGGSAVFNSSGREYKLFVSEADINGVAGSSLPQGATVGPLVDMITFGTGDKIYSAYAVTQNLFYSVGKGQSVDANGTVYPPDSFNYVVYDEGTIGGQGFLEMANSNDINAMSQLIDTDFIIEYHDSDNFVKLELVTPAINTNSGTVNIINVVDGIEGIATGMTYVIETHNNTEFFFVRDYQGLGQDLFLGRIDNVDNSNFVYGYATPAGQGFYFTQGGSQEGDIMDDIMLNEQARNKLLLIQGLNVPM